MPVIAFTTCDAVYVMVVPMQTRAALMRTFIQNEPLSNGRMYVTTVVTCWPCVCVCSRAPLVWLMLAYNRRPLLELLLLCFLFGWGHSGSIQDQASVNLMNLCLITCLIHCSLVTPYGDTYGSISAKIMACCMTAPNHYLQQCSSVRSSGIHLREISQNIPQSPITRINLKITYIS